MAGLSSPGTLIVGASGLVGWHVARKFPPGEALSVGFRNLTPAMRSLDIRDADAVRALIFEIAPRVIVHAAADPNVEACERDPRGTRRVNVDGVRNVIAAASEVGCRVVYFSSDYVFNGSSARAYVEDDPTDPVNEYGRQKVEAESIVLSESANLVCRTSGVFGWEHGRADCRNFVCQVVQRLEHDERVRAARDQSLCPTYAPDLAGAVSELIATGVQGVMHLAGPDVMTRVGFARLIAETFGLPLDRIDAVSTADLSLAAARPRFSALSTSRLRSTTAHLPRSARDALAEMARERHA